MQTESLAIENLELNEYEALKDGPPAGSAARGPRRPRTHNSRLLGTRAHVEVPAKPKHRRLGKLQRQARKANRA